MRPQTQKTVVFRQAPHPNKSKRSVAQIYLSFKLLLFCIIPTKAGITQAVEFTETGFPIEAFGNDI